MSPQGKSERSSERSAGLLLHPTSLPGRFGIGDFGPAAIALLDWMAAAGLSVWQVLPLGPAGFGHSPYSGFSAFAGNPLLLSPERLVADGLADESDLKPGLVSPSNRVDFAAVEKFKEKLLAGAFARWRENAGGARDRLAKELERFATKWRRRRWLDDWTLFAALKRRHGGAVWTEWPTDLARRVPKALAATRLELASEIERARFEQLLFDRQWRAVRTAARERGIRILGDLPIYVALDSADVWAHRRLFDLDADGRPRAVAGVPPDYFSEDGQRWGNPLYRWKEMASDGYRWFLDRLESELERADFVRLDHFRGYVAYWRIPASDPTARAGRWVTGPGEKLFRAAARRLGGLPFLAEDLGEIDEPVIALRKRLGLPGMRVLQFGFAEADSLHAPHRHEPAAAVYTGTHDNDTARGWIAGAGDEERDRALAYLGATKETISDAIVRAAMTSTAVLAVVPLQELLQLGSDARMNLPAKSAGNWSWRVKESDIPGDLAAKVRKLVDASARLPVRP